MVTKETIEMLVNKKATYMRSYVFGILALTVIFLPVYAKAFQVRNILRLLTFIARSAQQTQQQKPRVSS